MTSTEAAVIIRQAMIDNQEMAVVMAAALDKAGVDLYDWVEANPALAVMMAEQELAVQAELAGYAKQLEEGALGARPNDEPAT